jgi:uncharacterized Zn finger protein
MDDERLTGEPATTRCRSCGSDETEETRTGTKRLRERAATYQVIVACAACGTPFAVVARN